MGITLYTEPELNKPIMFVGWPGIGNIGIISVDTLRNEVHAEELGEIEPWDFFYPTKVVIKAGILENLRFPRNKFYYRRLGDRDVLFFIGEEQPSTRGGTYAEGQKAFEMANLVLDVAERFGCQRVYTSGAGVALTHHDMQSRVWAIASRKDLLPELKSYTNTILMGEVEGRGNQGNITGLNGLLVGVAKKRGLEGICLMGEIPDYLSRIPFPYPRASRSILEVFSSILDISIDMSVLDDMTHQMETIIENVYKQFPKEIKERIDQRKHIIQTRPGAITEEDEKWIKEHIDDFFKKGGQENDRTP